MATMPMPDYSVELELGEPPPELQDYAREHCGEDPSTRLQAIYELRDMILERGECTPHRMDDDFLVRFLRARNFIPARAHRLIVNYYQFKEDYPELVENVYPLDLHKVGDENVLAVPPYRGEDGRRLMIFRIGQWDPNTISLDELFRAAILALELGAMEPRTQILGAVALFDLEQLGSHHGWQLTPAVAAKLVKMLVSCFPTMTHAIHVINNSWISDMMFNIFKPFLTEDSRAKIHFHGYDVSSLHKHIPKEYLPERYGGNWPDYSYTIWLDSLRKNFDVAREMVKCGYKFREDELGPEVVRQLKEDGVELS